tara:strand:+ start:492 stop:779 length:288 start_codon:yes stop_codon:yes gene_type:complete
MNIETKNPELTRPIEVDSELKNLIVNHVGTAHKIEEHGEVNVAMIVESLIEEFPELLLAVAEENWIRGYHQALTDVAEGEQAMLEARENEEQESE